MPLGFLWGLEPLRCVNSPHSENHLRTFPVSTGARTKTARALGKATSRARKSSQLFFFSSSITIFMVNKNHDGNYSFNFTPPQIPQKHKDPLRQTASEVRRVLKPLMTAEQREQVDQNAQPKWHPGMDNREYLQYDIYSLPEQLQQYHVEYLVCKLFILVNRDRVLHGVCGGPKSQDLTNYERDFPSVLLHEQRPQLQLSPLYSGVAPTVAPTIAGPTSFDEVDELAAATDRLSLPATSNQTTSASNSGPATSSKPQQTSSRSKSYRSKTLPQTQNNSALPSSTVYHEQSSLGPTNSPQNVTTDYDRPSRHQKTPKDATRRRSWLQWHANDAERSHGVGQATRTRSSAPKANTTGVTSTAQPAFVDTGISSFLEPDELRLWYDPTVDRDLLKRLLRLRLDTDAVRSIIRRRVPNPEEAPLRAYMRRITQSARWDNLAND